MAPNKLNPTDMQATRSDAPAARAGALRLLPSHRSLCLLAANALLVMAAGSAQAQIYMCKDANGRTLTSDRPIPECANRAQKELRGNGTVKREIPPPLTPEQVRQKKEEEEKRKAEELAAAEQKRRDTVLLTTYQTEAQLEAERQRAVTQLRNNINIAITAQNNAEQRRKAAQTEADLMRKSGKPVPSALKNRIDDAQKVADHESKNVEGMEAEMAKVKLKYDDMLKRYRELNTPSASASASSKR